MRGIRNTKVLLLTWAISMGLAGISAAQTELHVSLSGDDSNPGTAAQPFRTLATALNEAMVGFPDKVVVKIEEGEYDDPVLDRPGEYTRPGIGAETLLQIEGGYDKDFSQRPGQTIFMPDIAPGPLSYALEINLAARQQFELSQLEITRTPGVALRLTSAPSGVPPADQSAAFVEINNCSFSGNLYGISVDMPIGPNGSDDATTSFSLTSSVVEGNSERGLIIDGVTNLVLNQVSITDTDAVDGVGLVLGSQDLRDGLIDNTTISGNRTGMELVQVGMANQPFQTNLTLRRSSLINNTLPSINDGVRTLTLDLGTDDPNPVVIENRTINTSGSLTVEDLRIEPTGGTPVQRSLTFDNVGSSGLHYRVQQADIRLGYDIRALIRNLDAVVTFEGTDDDDVIQTSQSGSHPIIGIMLESDPAQVASQLRILGSTSAILPQFSTLDHFSILGGEGDDEITISPLHVPLLVDGGPGNDTLTFTDDSGFPINNLRDVHLKGGPGDDTLTATTRADTGHLILEGGTGTDSVQGGAGDELVIWRDGDGIDPVLDAGTGKDTMRYVFDQNLAPSSISVGQHPSIASRLVVDTSVPAPDLVPANNFQKVEVITEVFSTPIDVLQPPAWVEILQIGSLQNLFLATVQSFVPAEPGGVPQEIHVIGDESGQSVLNIFPMEGNMHYTAAPTGSTSGLVEVSLIDERPVLPIHVENLVEVVLRGERGDDEFDARFWENTRLVILGEDGTDTLRVPASEEPYQEFVNPPNTFLVRSGYETIAYRSIEIPDTNPSNANPALPGDVNGDGSVNVADATMLANYLFNGGSLTEPDNADVDDDSDIDADDLDALVELIVN